jgi:hypothetical protein
LVQAEGCPVKTVTFPLSDLQTEISLDIGSPSFRYVAVEKKVGPNPRLCKARYMTNFAKALPTARHRLWPQLHQPSFSTILPIWLLVSISR